MPSRTAILQLTKFVLNVQCCTANQEVLPRVVSVSSAGHSSLLAAECGAGWDITRPSGVSWGVMPLVYVHINPTTMSVKQRIRAANSMQNSANAEQAVLEVPWTC